MTRVQLLMTRRKTIFLAAVAAARADSPFGGKFVSARRQPTLVIRRA